MHLSEHVTRHRSLIAPTRLRDLKRRSASCMSCKVAHISLVPPSRIFFLQRVDDALIDGTGTLIREAII